MNASRLNPRQREAVNHGGGPLLIVAGAGTGKTGTVAFRIARLVTDGVPPESILAVSFTNKAADELRGRVAAILRGRKKPPRISTFHSFCVRVLRGDAERLGFKKNFTIYDTSDQLSVMREVARETRIAGRDLDTSRLLWIISRAKSDGAVPDPGDGTDEYQLLASHLYSRYAAALRAYNALDFDDLLLMTLRLFREEPSVLEAWQKRAEHILVDEFQDTNHVQYDLVRLLAGKAGNLTVVGDDDQSIYGWRGAAPGNIHGFHRDWPKAQVITLDQNYRSTRTILSAANGVISNNPQRRPKNLWSDLGQGVPVTLLSCRTGEEEAAAVVERIVGLLAGGSCRGSECAVMFRTNAQSRLFEDALRRANLRYVVVGGMRFYDRKEVRDLMAYLSFLHNPRDEVALLRILNYPPRGIGRETVHRLQEKSLTGGRPLAEVMEGASSVAGVAERQAGAVARFLEHTKKMRTWFGPGRLALAARRLVDSVGLEEAVIGSVKDREAGIRKSENLREAVSALAAFELQEPEAGLGDYLAAVNLSGKEEESGENSSDSVVLLTVHSAKGLEFPFVFLAGFEEGLFPHERSSTTPGGLEEERRLAYVGMTRAMQELTITYAGERTRWAREIACLPSRFLDEIPEKTVVRATARGREVKIDPEEEAKTAGEYLARIRSRL